MEEMNPRRTRIHWAWLPTAIFAGVVAWFRYGALVTGLAVLGGLAVALYAEQRARRRRGRDGAD
jgi:Flp pilus assembly protein TadB